MPTYFGLRAPYGAEILEVTTVSEKISDQFRISRKTSLNKARS